MSKASSSVGAPSANPSGAAATNTSSVSRSGNDNRRKQNQQVNQNAGYKKGTSRPQTPQQGISVSPGPAQVSTTSSVVAPLPPISAPQPLSYTSVLLKNIIPDPAAYYAPPPLPPYQQPPSPQPPQQYPHLQQQPIQQYPGVVPHNTKKVRHNGQRREYQERVNPNQQPQQPQQQQQGTNNIPNAPPVSKEAFDHINPDDKIEAIKVAVDKRLNEMQSETDKLKSLQEEIRELREEKDVKIENLIHQREALDEHLKQIELQISTIRKQIKDIDFNISQLKQDQIQKIHALNEQVKELLED